MQHEAAPISQGRIPDTPYFAWAGLEPLARETAGGLASRYFGLELWRSATAIEFTVVSISSEPQLRRMSAWRALSSPSAKEAGHG